MKKEFFLATWWIRWMILFCLLNFLIMSVGYSWEGLFLAGAVSWLAILLSWPLIGLVRLLLKWVLPLPYPPAAVLFFLAAVWGALQFGLLLLFLDFTGGSSPAQPGSTAISASLWISLAAASWSCRPALAKIKNERNAIS